MSRMHAPAFLVAGVLGFMLVLAPGCGGGGCCGPGTTGGDPVEQAPAFLLEDVNATSASYGDLVSPRAYLGRVSAWYFGQAT